MADCAAGGEQVSPGKIVVAAHVVARPGDELIAYARQHLASYKAPRLVYVVGDLPRPRNGKVLRRALRASAPPARSSQRTLSKRPWSQASAPALWCQRPGWKCGRTVRAKRRTPAMLGKSMNQSMK